MYAFVFCFLWASQLGDVPAEFTAPVMESTVPSVTEGTPAASTNAVSLAVNAEIPAGNAKGDSTGNAIGGTPSANATSLSTNETPAMKAATEGTPAVTEPPVVTQGESTPAVETTPVVVTEAAPTEVFVSITRVRHFLRDLVATNQRSGGSCDECFDLDVPPAEAIPKTLPTLPEEISATEPATVPELKPEEIDPYVLDVPMTGDVPAGVAGNGQVVTTPTTPTVEEHAAAVLTVEGQAAAPIVEGQASTESATPKTPESETLTSNVPNAPISPMPVIFLF